MFVPTTFGKYLLLDRINVGGMAEVFRAKAFGVNGFERIIAIKQILPNIAEDEEFTGMFVDEARIAAQLSHPNIVQIYELGKINDQHYIAMEYVLGKDLRQILNRNRKREKVFPVPAAAYIACQLCEGLDYAHRKFDPTGKPLNIVHRDISPQNILVSFDGVVKIADFGIAKAEDRASRTQAGVLKGKFGYMSPEQVSGLKIDHRSDIFAVGVLLYEMITGKRLFVGGSDFSTLERVRKAEVVPPTEHNSEIPPQFEHIVLRALARDRDTRYPFASDLLDDLQSFLIDGATIFGAKHLSLRLHEDYRSEIEAEMRSIESYMKLSLKAVPLGSDYRGESKLQTSCENRMTVGSDFGDFENSPTLIGEHNSQEHSSAIENMDTEAVAVAGQDAFIHVQPRIYPENTGNTFLGVNPKNNPLTLLGVVCGIFFLILTGITEWSIVFGHETTGTLMVTTEPIQSELEIVLNGEIVATTTPFFMEEIPSGTYALEGRATGYESKLYTVKVAAGSDAVINIAFDGAVTPDDGIATILSEPLEASVYRGDEKIGITPFVLEGLKTDEPVRLTLKLDGYDDTELQGKFESGSAKLELNAVLKRSSSKTAP